MRHALTWINLKNIVWESSESEKSEQCVIPFIRTIRKWQNQRVIEFRTMIALARGGAGEEGLGGDLGYPSTGEEMFCILTEAKATVCQICFSEFT